MGATTALALAVQGINVHAVNKHNWVSQSPRAHITNLRAVEVLRALGVEEAALKHATPWEWMGDTSFSVGLDGVELARLRSWGTGRERFGDYLKSSPCTMLDLPQSILEPILINAAAKAGAQFSFNTEYLDHRQDEAGVTVRLRNRISDHIFSQRAQFLVGADGAKSKVAQDIGLEVSGLPARDGTAYVEFKADLSRYVQHRPSILHWILSPDAHHGEIGMGLLRAIRPWDHWIAGWTFDESSGKPDLSAEFALAQIRKFVGDPFLECEILGISTWFVNQQSAPHYSSGRVHCGGDAVHRHPPSGGLGSNTCIQDAFNLAWKLAFVVKGWAGLSLLKTYSAERAPVGHQIVTRANQSRMDYAPLLEAIVGEGGPGWLEKAVAKAADTGAEGAAFRSKLDLALQLKDREYNGQGAEMNQRYSSDAIIAEAGEEIFERDACLHVQPTTRPGAKIPHAWVVDRSGKRISVLDLVSVSKLTLFTGLSGKIWFDAIGGLGLQCLKAVVIGEDYAKDLYLDWARSSEIAEHGALIVRPDGFVAWRTSELPESADEAAAILASVVEKLLGQ